ncbi:mercury(II) reductase [Jeotgalibaca caeni]|uniref:mercury(II) reductase n=1 Tax=Jeotgalibaca caeni TaxID=3028623 RepID=UPI00237D35CF|nr:mercury(II) reductase [Jeotgalibaca caeni]MDE1548547.1 mercury(II) reductase [Jeotgalibaca caeni]
MDKYRLPIQGMTCAGCEEHVEEALQSIGATNIQADYRRSEATFEFAGDLEAEGTLIALKGTNYKPGKIEKLSEHRRLIAEDKRDYDFLIIGSGSAAFSAAIKAVEHGAKVGMIERGTVGGTCVNTGCVPSKTLLRAGEINRMAHTNPFIGLQTTTGEVALAPLMEQKNELVRTLRNQKYINLIQEYGFDLIQGEARFVDGSTVAVNGETFSARRFLIATGASPLLPAIPGLEEVDYLTSTSLLELEEVPKRLTVIGSGYIGRELGQLFHNLGTEVTLIQRSERLLKEYDQEISEAMEKSLTKQGIHFIPGVTYERVEQDGDVIKVHLIVDGEKRIIESEQLLVSAGRNPNTESLNLGAAGVLVGPRHEVKINEFAQTSNERIYAAGDVTLGPQFVYVASYEGGIAADNALGGLQRRIDLTAVPGVTFTNPAFATVGLTEKQADEKGYEVMSSVLPLEAVPRALANHETTGVIKLVADRNNRKILGVHVVAEQAGEVIYAATLAVKFGLTVDDLKETLAPYLTMAEGLKLAALAFDKDIAKLSCCAG